MSCAAGDPKLRLPANILFFHSERAFFRCVHCFFFLFVHASWKEEKRNPIRGDFGRSGKKYPSNLLGKIRRVAFQSWDKEAVYTKRFQRNGFLAPRRQPRCATKNWKGANSVALPWSIWKFSKRPWQDHFLRWKHGLKISSKYKREMWKDRTEKTTNKMRPLKIYHLNSPTFRLMRSALLRTK